MREENVIFTLLSRTLNRTAMYGPRLAMSFCVPNCRSIIFVFARTIAREVVGSEKIDVKCNPLNDLVGSAKQYNCD